MLSTRKSSICCWLLLGLAGCGGGPGVVSVTGTLTYKGKAVPNAVIDFFPEKGRPCWGQTDDQGKFILEYDDKNKGAVPGKYKVAVRYRPTTDAEKAAAMDGRAPAMSKDMAAFYDKYGSANSKIEVTVQSGANNLKLDWD